jgi:hypothetical protein
MRLRHPAVAATALGLAAAVVPATPAGAATPDREFGYGAVVTIHRADGSTYQCGISARFIWHLGEDTPDDDWLFASTQAPSGADPDCEYASHSVVTLHWSADGNATFSKYSYTAEGSKNQDIYAPPTANSVGGAFYNHPSSEHHWIFSNCASNCDIVHTFNPK